LSVKPVLARELGTRHRAGIGVTEETDCLALIVSEETGKISVAAFGELEIDVTARRLEERIADHLINKRRPGVYRGATVEPAGNLGRQAAHDAHSD
jgi:Uncharacterized conserved protein